MKKGAWLRQDQRAGRVQYGRVTVHLAISRYSLAGDEVVEWKGVGNAHLTWSHTHFQQAEPKNTIITESRQEIDHLQSTLLYGLGSKLRNS